MRALDPDFQAHLDARATTLATCWRIVRRDGFALGFTDHDRALQFDGATYLPDSGATGTELAASADLAVDNAELEGALTADALSAADLAAGRYDGASVEIFRVNWANTDQRVLLKKGVIGDVSAIGDRFRAEFRGASHRLDETRGRIYQRLCDVDLGATPCSVDLDDAQFKTSGTVTALQDAERFFADGFSSFADGWFAHGKLTWTSGANAGAAAQIKTQSATGAIALWLPPGAGVAIGDQFSATAGCDKRFATCKDKFANGINFRGFHLMPGNDFVISYPLRGEDNDGGSLA